MSALAPRPAQWSGLATLLVVLLMPGFAFALSSRKAEVPQPESLLLLGVGLIVVAVVVAWARRRPGPDR
jgi:uncharacterized membrane protein